MTTLCAFNLRSINISYDIFGYSDSSVILEMGNTKVQCCITLQDGVPPFLRGQNTGWLTAEYAMLPSATRPRSRRESELLKRNSRSVEISRLIGRSLRVVTDLSLLGERTIVVDCDVLQADGGTRVACITAASKALERAANRWVSEGIFERSILIEPVAAISAGLIDGSAVLDLDQEKDARAQSDFNFVITQSGKIVEIQGTAEQQPLEWDQFQELCDLAREGVVKLFKCIGEERFEHKYFSSKQHIQSRQ